MKKLRVGIGVFGGLCLHTAMGLGFGYLWAEAEDRWKQVGIVASAFVFVGMLALAGATFPGWPSTDRRTTPS